MIAINGSYYKNPTFPTLEIDDEIIENKNEGIIPRNTNTFMDLLSLNLKKKIIVHSNDDINGILEYTGNDCIIIYDPSNGNYHIIKIYDINYVEFEEKIKTF